ncbi:hypothetical protein OTU49_006318 [Cherax quadricarinatus]|uniref:Uncharacterized protein n=1 Tax=Cherax quadricarinatus TaxID=27406 RepID=A0AAW0X195_CHEQU
MHYKQTCEILAKNSEELSRIYDETFFTLQCVAGSDGRDLWHCGNSELNEQSKNIFSRKLYTCGGHSEEDNCAESSILFIGNEPVRIDCDNPVAVGDTKIIYLIVMIHHR